MPAPSLGHSLAKVADPYVESTGGASIAKAVDTLALDYKKKADTTALLGAQKAMDDWENTNLFDPQNGALSKRGKNAFDLPNTLGSKYDEDMTAITSGLTGDQQEAFQKMVSSRRGTLMQTLFTHERGEMDKYRGEVASAAEDSAINRAALYAGNPEVESSAINAAKAARFARDTELGLPEEAISNNQIEVESKARLTALSRLADTDQRKAVSYYEANQDKFSGKDLLSAQSVISPTRKKLQASDAAKEALASTGPKTESADAIGYVLNTLEGDKLITDSNGALAKWGINQAANPDLDVSSLTYEQAQDRAKKQYWDAIKADELSPQMRLPAFAFAFNAGPAAANKLIAEADGDPRKLLELQAQFYQDLAVKNPAKYGGNLEGWMNRLRKVSGQLDNATGEIPNELDLYKRIDETVTDPDVATQAKSLVSKQLTDMKQAQTEGYNKASSEAWQYKANGMDVPPTVLARMSPKDQAEMMAKEQDPVVYERVRNQIAYGQPVDLETVRWQMSPKQFQELRQVQTNPRAQAFMRGIDDVVTSGMRSIINKKKPTEAKDFERLNEFRDQLMTGIEDFQNTNKKVATDDDIAKIGDRILKKNRGGGLLSALGLSSGGDYKVKAIPQDRRFMVKGQEVGYADMMADLTKYAQQRNIPVNDENLAQLYTTLKSKNIILEKY